MPRTPKEIWEYFSKQAGKDKRAECNLCFKILSFKTTITNLKAHLQHKHPVNYMRYKAISGLTNTIQLRRSMPLNARRGSDPGPDTTEGYTFTKEEEEKANDDTERRPYQSKSIKTPRSSTNYRRTPVWNYFYQVGGQDKMAICKTCSKMLSYKTTVSNLKTHLMYKHDDLYKKCLSECYDRNNRDNDDCSNASSDQDLKDSTDPLEDQNQNEDEMLEMETEVLENVESDYSQDKTCEPGSESEDDSSDAARRAEETRALEKQILKEKLRACHLVTKPEDTPKDEKSLRLEIMRKEHLAKERRARERHELEIMILKEKLREAKAAADLSQSRIS